MAQAIKISKEGYDVTKATDNQLIFNSDHPLFKIHKQGSDQVIVGGSSVRKYTIYHEVGKIPMYFIRGQYMLSATVKSEQFNPYPLSTYFGVGIYGHIAVKPYIDKIEIYWSYPGIVPQLFKFDYFIFEDPIID